jgi:hypothetical protein
MATYYVDNVGGSNSNNGTSTGTAKATLEGFSTAPAITLVAGDIIRQKATGVDYVWSTATANTTFTSVNILWTNYTTDTTNPVNVYNKPSGAFSWTITGGVLNSIKNVDQTFDFGSNGDLTIAFFSPTTSNARTTFNSCKFIFKRTGGSTTQAQRTNNFMAGTGSSQKGSFYNCIFEGDDNNYIFSPGNIGFFSGNTFKGFVISTNFTVFSASTTFERNIFECRFGANTSGLIIESGSPINVRNNTFIIRADLGANTYTGCAIFTKNSTTTTSALFVDNICMSEKSTGSMYLYKGSALTVGDNEFIAVGNNPYYGNFTGLTTGLTNFIEGFGTSPNLSGSPFLSTTYGNANYCKLDTSNSNAITYCIGTSPMSVNLDTGRYESNYGAGGATPNNYDLRAGVVVGSVTGTLVIPAITDVRTGTNYDVAPNAKTGTLDLPSVADVKLAVSFDGATKTGTLESTDPGITNVVSGTTYKINSVSKTGSRTSIYALQSANNVRSGVALGDGNNGTLDLPVIANVKLGITYDGLTKTGTLESTDPGVTNVVSGVTYKIESVLKTGTRTNIYALLNAADVRLGVDRGNTTNGTLDLPAIANVNYGTVFDNATKTGTKRDTSPSVTDVVSGITWYANSVLQTGTRTSIYALLTASLVKIGTDRGDGVFGSYDGSDRFSDPLESNVKTGTSYVYNTVTKNGTYTEAGLYSDAGEANVLKDVAYKFNSATNNKLGTLESTDPGISNVKTGTNYKINSVAKSGTHTEAVTDTILASDLKFGVTKTIKDVSVTGTDIGADFNDNLDPAKVELGFAYKNLNENKTGTLVGGSCDYPTPEKVYDGIVYASGTKTGILGAINQLDLDYIKQMVDTASVGLQANLGANYQPLKYFKDVAKNDFYSNANQFGIRALNESITKEKVGGMETVDVEFEIKITTDFENRDGDDFERIAELSLIEQMENVRRHLRVSKFYFMKNVRIVKEFDRAEVNEINGTLVCRAIVKVNINVNNG